ncbi:MAG: hypothetical protein ABSH00_19430 [Bryobacteraceae bacterium]|jgi:hypothetical protein
MIQTLIKNRWLLALCGVFYAAYSVMNLLYMEGRPDGFLTLRRFAGYDAVRNMGMVAFAAGVCAIAASTWSSRKGRPWLLALNGLALSAFAVITTFGSRGRLSFRPISLLFVVMAMSIGILALATALRLRRHVAGEWLLSAAGVASVGFAVGFFALGFNWIRLKPPYAFFVWMASYFGFGAILMLGIAVRLNGLRADIHRMASRALPTG